MCQLASASRIGAIIIIIQGWIQGEWWVSTSFALSACLSHQQERGEAVVFNILTHILKRKKEKQNKKAYTQHSNGPEREREEGRFFAISNTQTDQFSVSSTSSGRLGRGGESEAELCREKERGLIAKQTRTWLELLLLLPLQVSNWNTHIYEQYIKFKKKKEQNRGGCKSSNKFAIRTYGVVKEKEKRVILFCLWGSERKKVIIEFRALTLSSIPSSSV